MNLQLFMDKNLVVYPSDPFLFYEFFSDPLLKILNAYLTSLVFFVIQYGLASLINMHFIIDHVNTEAGHFIIPSK